MSTTLAPSGARPIPSWGNYLALLDLEKDQIERVKWVHSERLGRDVGWDYAVWIWETTERKAWLERTRLAGLKQDRC